MHIIIQQNCVDTPSTAGRTEFRMFCPFKSLSGDLRELEGRIVSDKEENLQRQMNADSRLPHFF